MLEHWGGHPDEIQHTNVPWGVSTTRTDNLYVVGGGGEREGERERGGGGGGSGGGGRGGGGGMCENRRETIEEKRRHTNSTLFSIEKNGNKGISSVPHKLASKRNSPRVLDMDQKNPADPTKQITALFIFFPLPLPSPTHQTNKNANSVFVP
jgi:hypothetical protein